MKLKLAVVLWEDAAMAEHEDMSGTIFVTNTGWMLPHTKRDAIIKLASSVAADGCWRDIMSIPKANIVKTIIMGKTELPFRGIR